MDEQTVNDELDFSMDEVATSKPEEQIEQATVEETGEQQTDDADNAETTEDVDNTQPEVDEDDAFIRSKHLDPSDSAAFKKMAGMYRNAEKLMNEKSQEAARLQRIIAQQQQRQPNGQQPQGDAEYEALKQEFREMRNENLVSDFKSRVNVTPEIEQKMMDYIVTNPHIGQLIVDRKFSLDDVYKLVGGGQIDPTQMKEQIRKQTLAEVANKQNAKRMNSGATDQTQFSAPKDDGDIFIESFES